MQLWKKQHWKRFVKWMNDDSPDISKTAPRSHTLVTKLGGQRWRDRVSDPNSILILPQCAIKADRWQNKHPPDNQTTISFHPLDLQLTMCAHFSKAKEVLITISARIQERTNESQTRHDFFSVSHVAVHIAIKFALIIANPKISKKRESPGLPKQEIWPKRPVYFAATIAVQGWGVTSVGRDEIHGVTSQSRADIHRGWQRQRRMTQVTNIFSYVSPMSVNVYWLPIIKAYRCGPSLLRVRNSSILVERHNGWVALSTLNIYTSTLSSLNTLSSLKTLSALSTLSTLNTLSALNTLSSQSMLNTLSTLSSQSIVIHHIPVQTG